MKTPENQTQLDNPNNPELQQKIEAAKCAPDVAHLILGSGPYPICELCGGTDAPIINGQHLSPEKWCKTDSPN